MIKHIGIILIAGFVALQATAQRLDDIQTPKLIPPSPDAAALGKYGEIPVDKSTGIPSISIPLYEIKTPRFTIPVSLSYHASGIRVEEVSSWVGAGWALNSGGVITRTMVGFPDDGGFGFLTNHSQIKHAADIQWPADITYISKVVTRQLDTQPDNFFYNFTSHAGAFVFGDDAKPVLIPYKPIKLNFNLSSKNFDVTDEQGNMYKFTTKETVINSDHNFSGVSSWYLDQMVSADHSDTINFIYATDAVAQTQFSYNFAQTLGNCPGGTYSLQPLVKTAPFRQFNTVRISSILFKGGKVDFISKSGRLDEGIVSLDSVIVSTLNSANQYVRLKSFKLLTDYFYSTLAIPPNFMITIDEADKHRLKLVGLQEMDANNTPVKTHQFDYNPGMLPQVHSFAQDLWGYFNGKIANQTLLQTKQVTVQNGSSSYVDYVANGIAADRSVSPVDAQAGILQKITYPTKGYTVFSYESNKKEGTEYTTQTTSASGIGLHTETSIVNYTPTNDMLGSGGNIFHVKLRRGNDNPGYPLPYVQVIRVSDGAIIYNLSSTATTGADMDVILTLAAATPYQLKAVAIGGTDPTSSTLPYAIISTTYQAPSGSNLITMGGLRVSSISNYNADGTLLQKETYLYGNNNQSGGGIQMAFSLATSYTHGTACAIGGSSGTGFSGNPLGFATTYTNNSYYPMSMLNGSPVGYPTVTVYNGDQISNTGKMVYNYSISPDSLLFSYATNWNGIKPLSVPWKNGDPVKEDYYINKGNNLYVLTKSIKTDYNTIYRKQATGTVIEYNPEPITDPGDNCSNFINPFLYAGDGKVYSAAGGACTFLPSYFYWYDYPISTGVRIPATITTVEYDSTGTLALMTSAINYFYDDTTYMPTRTISADSKGRTITLYTYRPINKSAINALTPLSATASAAIDSMIARNILTPVVQQARYINSNLSELSLTNYNNWSPNVIAPQTIQTQITPYSLETRLQYNRYDASGNALELQKASGMKEVYLWGYHSLYPVAKIQNTTYAIASTYITQSVLDNPTSDATLRSQLNNLRSIPNTFVSTYTYKPLIGLTSATDPQGKTIFYEYDAFSRLKDIKDKDGNIVKTFDYHYKGQ